MVTLRITWKDWEEGRREGNKSFGTEEGKERFEYNHLEDSWSDINKRFRPQVRHTRTPRLV